MKSIGKTDEEIEEQIENGLWKMRGGGREKPRWWETEHGYKFTLASDYNIAWLGVLDEPTRQKVSLKRYSSEIIVEPLSHKEKAVLKRVLNKMADCVHCGACAAECSVGAIVINKNDFFVDITKCVHCFNCLQITAVGCLRSTSMYTTKKYSKGG